MTDRPLRLIGLMKKAGKIEPGSDRSSDAVRSGKARLLLLPSDASEATVRKAERLLTGRRTMMQTVPFSRNEIAEALGIGDCTMAVITDMGFAGKFMELLAAEDPDVYASAAEMIKEKEKKIIRRKKEKGPGETAHSNRNRRTHT